MGGTIMLKFTIKRILQAIPLVFLVTVLAFLIINAAPGDPINMFINPEIASKADVAALRANLGLDKPIIIRYFMWLGNILHGNLGMSYQHSRPVWDLLIERLPNTLILALLSTILSFLIAIPAGIISAIKKNSIWDYIFSVISFIGVSIPSFWLGLMLILLFSLKLGWLPSGGMRENFEQFLWSDRLKHLLLPTLILGFSHAAGIMRYMRSSMLEVINQDYIRTARSKGLSEKIVIYKHALRNALLPIITMLGFIIPGLFSGAVITETIFSWPGIGRLTVEATFQRNYPIMMGSILVSSILIIIGSLLADLGYALADPRIKYN
jgi:peptide/nickel transport system permease protein